MEELEGVPDLSQTFSFDDGNADEAEKLVTNKNFSNNNLANYKRIMFLGRTLNEFYNHTLQLEDESSTDIKEETQKGLDIF